MDHIDRFVASARAGPSGTGFVLDFDGTLSPIAPTPAEARALPGAPAVLAALAARYPTVAVLSGRRAEDIWGLIPVAGVRYIGLYGAEELTPGEPVRAIRPAPSGLVAAAQAFVRRAGLEGAEVEDKGHSVALHYRNAPDPATGPALGAWAAARAAELGLQVRPGRKVVELTPPGPTKADAVGRLIAEEGLRRVIVAGDDVSDVGALRRAGKLLGPGALRIGVQSAEAPPALAEVSDVTVPGPEGVLQVLRRFA